MPDSRAIVIAVLAIVAGGVLACEPDQGDCEATRVVTSEVPGSPSPAASSVSVLIQNFQFVPNSTTVKVGTTVTWTNMDSAQHTVTRPLEGGVQIAGPDSAVLNHGDTYSYTYDAAGFYPYHCRIHPSLRGMVEVTP